MAQTAVPPFTIGIDVGGTKTEALIVDQECRVRGHADNPTDTTNAECVIAGITQTAYDVMHTAGATSAQLRVIGVGIPGLIDPQTGVVRQAVNLNLEKYPLGEMLTAEFGAPSFIENDVRAAAVGAFEYINRHESVTNIAYLSIGTGISAGLILDGQLYRGSNGMAGEIGHAVVEPNGERCTCGMHGCLETIVPGPAIIRQALTADAAIAHFAGENTITAGHVYQAAQAGNISAQRVIQRVSDYLARTIQWLIMAYDVDKVLLGGGVSRSGDAFLQPILQAMHTLRQDSPLAQEMLRADKIALLPAAYNAGIWGGIWIAQRAIGTAFDQ